jgi:hypothetical protein
MDTGGTLMAALMTRKEADSLIERTYAEFNDLINNSGIRRMTMDSGHKTFLGYTDALFMNFDNGEYKEAVASLDMASYTQYFGKFAELSSLLHLPTEKAFKNAELLDSAHLAEVIEKTESAGKITEILSGFSTAELSILPYNDKSAAVDKMLEAWTMLSGRERQFIKLTDSFTDDELPAFLAYISEDRNSRLRQIFKKVNGKERTQLLAFFNTVLTQKGLADSKGKEIRIPAGYTASAQFTAGGISLAWYKTDANGTVIDQKNADVSPFSLILYPYKKETVEVPALTFLSNDGQEDFLFENKYGETLNFTELTQAQKDAMFWEFTRHYLPGSIWKELLGDPVQAIIMALLCVLAADAAPEIAGTIALMGGGLSIAQVVSGACTLKQALDARTNAKSMQELKAAAKEMAEALSKVGINIVTIIFMAAKKVNAKGKIRHLKHRNIILEQNTNSRIRSVINANPNAKKTYIELIDQGQESTVNNLKSEDDIVYALTFIKGNPRATTLFIESKLDLRAVEAAESGALVKYTALHRKLAKLKKMTAGRNDKAAENLINSIFSGKDSFTNIERAAICKLRIEGKISQPDILIRAQAGDYKTLYQDKLFAWTSDPFLLSGQKKTIGSLREILGIDEKGEKNLYIDIIVRSDSGRDRLTLKNINKQAVSNGVKSYLEKMVTELNSDPTKSDRYDKFIADYSFGDKLISKAGNTYKLGGGFNSFKQKYIDSMDIKAPGKEGVKTLIINGSKLSKSEIPTYNKAYDLINQATGANIFFSGCDITVMPGGSTGAPEYGVLQSALGGDFDISRINGDDNGVQIFSVKINTDTGVLSVNSKTGGKK